MRAFLVAVVAVAACNTVAQPAMDPAPGNVDTAAVKYPDLRTFWGRSVDRTCGPNSGVCHDNRQFPDLQTASGLLDAVNRRCNQIRDNPATIDNLCEPPGDTVQIGTFSSRIGKVTPSPAINPTTLVVTLHDPIPSGMGTHLTVVRQPAGLKKISIAVPDGAVMAAQAGSAKVTLAFALLTTPAPGGTLQNFLAPSLYVPGDLTQVEEGDPNGDGVFGADLGGALVKPGAPLASYLFLRMRSPLKLGPGEMLTNVAAPAVEEAQMPIANFQYWDLDNSETALWCWISGMKPDGSNADGPIDYAHCDTSAMPPAVHQGDEATAFSSVYASVLRPSCSSCHFAGTQQPTTFIMGSLQETYDALLGISGHGPSENQLGLPFVTRADRSKSYLYLKITKASTIEGAQMPLGSALPQAAIDAVGKWIDQGANNN